MAIMNAVIKEAKIKIERECILDCWLFVKRQDGFSQGFGGWSLYLERKNKLERLKETGNLAGHYIYRLMQIADVNDWGKIRGKAIRIDIQDDLIRGIGHIIKDDWFYPEKDFKEACDDNI